MNHENKVILINHLVFDTGDGLSSLPLRTTIRGKRRLPVMERSIKYLALQKAFT